MARRRAWMLGVLAGMAAVLLAGCRIESSKQGGGDQVRLMTPVGGLQVKTNAAAAEVGIGLPVYPGAALLAKGEDGEDVSSADINLSLGSMRLRVKTLHYRSGDDPAAVEAFYAKQLGRFGVVIRCRGEVAVGEPARTPEGLTCASDGHSGVRGEAHDKGEMMLKAGSPEHQHLVDVKAGQGSGTDFGLIALDLPRGLAGGGDAEK